jgi:mono/diheme cytochrome c family protein
MCQPRSQFRDPRWAALTLFGAVIGQPCRGDDATAVAKVIVPFVEKHCVACHGAKKPEAGLSLDGFRDVKAILAERTMWEEALHRIEAGEMPPEDRPQPTAAEKAAVAAGVRGIYARADAGPPDPGPTAMRRLSRREYGATVRDLLQLDLDFNPEQELPADAVTLGFDNNVEALTISPVQLDRFMATATMIAERAIWANPPKPEISRAENQSNILPSFRVVEVPVAKVLETLTAIADAKPGDAGARHRLARLHATAYGLKADKVRVRENNEAEGPWHGLNPDLLPFEVRRVEDEAKNKAAAEHLERALARYREVLQLEPANLAARLGIAWCILQGGDKATAASELREVIDAAWTKEKDLGPGDWKSPSTLLAATGQLLGILDKTVDAKEIAALRERAAPIEKAAKESPWKRYRLIRSDGGAPALTGPMYVSVKGNNVGIEPLLRYAGTDEFLFRVKAFVEQASEPVRVALFMGATGLSDRSSDEELDQIVGGAELRGMGIPIKILTTVEVTARSIDDPQRIETVVSRRGRRGPLDILGIGLVRSKDGAAPVRLHFDLESEGPLPPISHRHILACSADKSRAEQTREIVGRLLPRAFRGPVTKDEIEAVAAFADRAMADGKTWEAGMQHTLAAMLCSSRFLMRAELDDRPEAAEPHPIDDYALASRLSYFLWSSMPDDELLALAAEKKLAANLEPQVRRMLRDQRSRALVDNFFLQWLRLDGVRMHEVDRKTFPKFEDQLRESMLGETRWFLDDMIRSDRSLLELIDARHTFLDAALARHYGIGDTLGNRPGAKVAVPGGGIPKGRFVRVDLQDDLRGGLLSQAALLTVTSAPTRTSPVKRGAWVLENILGTPPPPPPPDVAELDQKDAVAATMRERLEQHRANPACAACHAKIDPLGFAFEHYDAVGAFRTREGNKDIDASGKLPDGRTINGLGDLKKALLAEKDRFVRHVAEKMLTYALGRKVEYYDRRAVDRIVSAVSQDEYRLSRLVIAIVESDPVRLRRGKEPAP